jgi:hypothetical protein
MQMSPQHAKYVEMGFNPDAVRRAHQTATDEKYILDYLIAFQDMSTAFPAAYIHLALEAYPKDMEHARMFCTHYSSLAEFGFESAAIARALVKHGNKKDEALEELLGASR